MARWGDSCSTTDSPSSSSANLADRSSIEAPPDEAGETSTREGRVHRRASVADFNAEKRSKESNADRLHYVLEQPRLRAMFREFLRHNFCEENLAFWMEVEDFKRKFLITSSAMASNPPARPGSRSTPGQAAMEKHHEQLIQTASLIFNNYLAQSSPAELNIDHAIRQELLRYLEEVVSTVTGKVFQGRLEPEQASAFNATQLQHVIRLYERIQSHVFRLMATDSVPKVSLWSLSLFIFTDYLFVVYQNPKFPECAYVGGRFRTLRSRYPSITFDGTFIASWSERGRWRCVRNNIAAGNGARAPFATGTATRRTAATTNGYSQLFLSWRRTCPVVDFFFPLYLHAHLYFLFFVGYFYL